MAFHIDTDARGARAALGECRITNASVELRAEVLDTLLGSEGGLESILLGHGAVVAIEKPGTLSAGAQPAR